MGRARQLGGVFAALLVGGFLVWGVAGGWDEATRYSWEPDWALIAASVVALAGFYATWGTGYILVLEFLAGRRVDRRRFAGIWAKSLLGRYVPGNVLMVAGRVVLGREAGVPGSVSLGASVYEQISMLAMAALASVGFLVVEGTGGSPAFWAVLVVPAGLLVLDPAIFGRLSSWALARAGRSVRLEALGRGQLLVLLVWFGASMALLGAGIGLGIRGLAGPGVGSVAYAGLGFLLSWALSMVAFVFPSGLGVREGVLAVVLSRHLPGPAAVSVAAASRLLMTAVELVVVGAVIAAARRVTPPATAPARGR